MFIINGVKFNDWPITILFNFLVVTPIAALVFLLADVILIIVVLLLLLLLLLLEIYGMPTTFCGISKKSSEF